MMNLAMSILSVKYVQRLNFIRGGQTEDKLVRRTWAGIDYQACSPDWKARTVNAWVYKKHGLSDHAPVIIDYKI